MRFIVFSERAGDTRQSLSPRQRLLQALIAQFRSYSLSPMEETALFLEVNHFHPRRPYATVVEGVMWE